MSLEVQNLFKSFRQGENRIEVLRGVNFNAQAGESVAIVGQSGSGKSTLLALLAGLDQPDQGSVKFAGTELSKLNEEELAQFRAKSLGIVFQQFHLMSDLTAEENVALPLELHAEALGLSRAEILKRAREQLDQVGLAHRRNHLPRQLSGGECQRVAIARALVLRPGILLADEPTGNLDFDTAKQVTDTIFTLAKKAGAVLLLVTHSEELAKRCGRRLKLVQGKIE